MAIAMENLHIVEVRPIKTIIYSSHCHVECHRVCKYKYYIIYRYTLYYTCIYIHIHTLDYNNHTSCEAQHEQCYLVQNIPAPYQADHPGQLEHWEWVEATNMLSLSNDPVMSIDRKFFQLSLGCHGRLTSA